jgi:DNA-directed RNA polymerase specialized sigma24 family protein
MNDLYYTTKEQVTIDLLRRGNEDAFRYFYDRYWNVVYLFIRQKCSSPKLAEDGAQEVFHTLWVSRSQIYHDIVLKHFLAIGCVRTVLSGLKHAHGKRINVTTMYTQTTQLTAEGRDTLPVDDIMLRASTTD